MIGYIPFKITQIGIIFILGITLNHNGMAEDIDKKERKRKYQEEILVQILNGGADTTPEEDIGEIVEVSPKEKVKSTAKEKAAIDIPIEEDGGVSVSSDDSFYPDFGEYSSPSSGAVGK